VVSFLLPFPPKSSMHSSSPSFVLHALPLSSSLAWSFYHPLIHAKQKWCQKNKETYILSMRKIIFPGLSEQFTQTTELLNINLYTNIQQLMYKWTSLSSQYEPNYKTGSLYAWLETRLLSAGLYLVNSWAHTQAHFTQPLTRFDALDGLIVANITVDTAAVTLTTIKLLHLLLHQVAQAWLCRTCHHLFVQAVNDWRWDIKLMSYYFVNISIQYILYTMKSIICDNRKFNARRK
jgi:hypothetical protein